MDTKARPTFSLIFACFFLGLLGVSFFLGGCDVPKGNSQFIVAKWHKQDLDAHLGKWLAVAPTPSGLLLGKFDRQWQARASSRRRSNTHSRLIFTMIKGYETTGDTRYLDAAMRGTEFLLNRFYRPSIWWLFFQCRR